MIAEDFEDRFPDVDWKYQLQNHNKAILFRITGKTTKKDTIKTYFDRYHKQIRSEQLTQIFLPGRTKLFFQTDESAGIHIDQLMHVNSWSDNRLKMKSKVSRHNKQLKIFSFESIRAHRFDSAGLKQSAYAHVGEDRLLLASLVDGDTLRVIYC